MVRTLAKRSSALPPDAADSSKKKYYVSEMLPIPPACFTWDTYATISIGDALARYMWMNGYNVLHPMGWDSFGLPAETPLSRTTLRRASGALGNIAKMKAQMKRLGLRLRLVARKSPPGLPDYYRWNQWFFLKFYEKGLAYRKNSRVNWCPKCRHGARQ